MKKSEIKTIHILFGDNDFIRAFDWIGRITLYTLIRNNICGEQMLEDSETIEKFVKSLIPTALQFVQYNCGKYDDEEVEESIDYFKSIKFYYNDPAKSLLTDMDTLFIDLENNLFKII